MNLLDRHPASEVFGHLVQPVAAGREKKGGEHQPAALAESRQAITTNCHFCAALPPAHSCRGSGSNQVNRPTSCPAATVHYTPSRYRTRRYCCSARGGSTAVLHMN